jgi:hypothetical protein
LYGVFVGIRSLLGGAWGFTADGGRRTADALWRENEKKARMATVVGGVTRKPVVLFSHALRMEVLYIM